MRGGPGSVSSGFADGAGGAAAVWVSVGLPPAGRKPKLSSASTEGRPWAAPRLRPRGLASPPPPQRWRRTLDRRSNKNRVYASSVSHRERQ